MEAFSEWMSNLIIFLLAAFLLELLLPSSALQKYARLVLSFILMLLIIEPLLNFTAADPEKKIEETIENWRNESFDDQSLEIEMNEQKNEIEAGQDAYISKQVANQLKEQAAGDLKEEWGWEVEDITIDSKEKELDPENISVFVTLRKAVEEKGDAETTKIEPVHINIEDKPEEESGQDASRETKEVTSFLAETWNMKEDQIQVSLMEEDG